MAGFRSVLRETPDLYEWSRFFEEAGLPANISATYAIAFSKNRIKSDMLRELNNTYFELMGINVVGDMIAIRRHANNVLGELARESVSNNEATNNPLSVNNVKLHDKSTSSKNDDAPRFKSKNVTPVSDDEDNETTVSTNSRKSLVIESQKRKLVKKNEKKSVEIKRTVPTSSVSVGPVTKKLRKVVPTETQTDEPRILQKKAVPKKKTDVFSRLGEETQSSSSLSNTTKSFIITADESNKSRKVTENVFSRLGDRSTPEPDCSGIDSSDYASELDPFNASFIDNEYTDDQDGYIEQDETLEEPEEYVPVRQKPVFKKVQRVFPTAAAPSRPPPPVKKALPYFGILKSSKSIPNKPKVLKKVSSTMRADQEQRRIVPKVEKPVVKRVPIRAPSPSPPSNTEGILTSGNPNYRSINIKDRLGNSRPKPQGSIVLNMKKSSIKPTQVKAIGSTTVSTSSTEVRKRTQIGYQTVQESTSLINKSFNNSNNRPTSSIVLGGGGEKRVTFGYVQEQTFQPPIRNNRGGFGFKKTVFNRLG